MEPFKLRVKIGMHEFEAEGDEAAVREQFSVWQNLLGGSKSVSTSAAPGEGEDSATAKEAAPVGQVAMWDAPFTKDQLSKVFDVNLKSNLVTLKVQPTGDGRPNDTLLLIIYGYKTLRNWDTVKVGFLKDALVRSGVNVDRVDRLAMPCLRKNFLHKGGMGRGGHYGVTNTGTEHAMKIIDEMLKR
jgi:hypothetical protein